MNEKELKTIIDALLIENTLNRAHLKTVTSGLQNLATLVLTKEQSKEFHSKYYHTLLDESNLQLSELEKGLYFPHKTFFAKSDLNNFVNHRLKDLEL